MGPINKSQTAIGLGMIGVGILGIYGGMIIEISDPSEAGSRMLPLGIATVIIVLGLLEVVSGVLSREQTVGSVWVAFPPNFKKVVLLILACIFYVWTIGALGYLVATSLVCFLVLLLFGERRMLVLILVVLLVPAAYYLFFFKVLGVYPPQGEYFDLMNYLQKD